MHRLPIQGPMLVVMGYLLTVASMAIQARTVTLHVINHSPYLNVVEEYTTYTMVGLHFFYILTLLPFKRPQLGEESLNVQNYDRIDEVDPLLSSEQRHRVYGSDITQGDDRDLGEGETRNCFSWLFFHWVQPLMAKGSKGRIKNANDLFDLPPRLKTDLIENTFRRAMNRKDILDEKTTNLTRSEADSRLVSFQELPDIAIVSNTNRTQVDPNEVTSKNKPVLSLLQALHRAFGKQYYSVGILKLIGDLLGFAGPILLKLLVSFIENKIESSWHGYLYAGGLCGSTFLSSMFSSHFNYLVQMIGLKIRAAVISTVYRKSLVVNSVSLSNFNTGEVVNFMSTDTDRIVNFCPSFHLFWSLPFQIAVSLYLLYQQVFDLFI